jgi:hypothetical protein
MTTLATLQRAAEKIFHKSDTGPNRGDILGSPNKKIPEGFHSNGCEAPGDGVMS